MEQVLLQLEHLIERAMQHEWAWRIVIGLAMAVIGIWLARWVARAFDRLMRRMQLEEILRNFLRNVAYAAAIIVALIAALDFAGVPTTSMLAVMGAAGLGIGLALKDSLSNIASGVMLIVLRPFHSGDHVLIAGQEGIVEGVRIFQTSLHTSDNRQIILPNSQITTAPIVNYSARGDRRLDVNIGIGYSNALVDARAALLELAKKHRSVKPNPEPMVLLNELSESSMIVQLRVWVTAADYSLVRAELLEDVLKVFSVKGIKLPGVQRELHLHHHGSALSADDLLGRAAQSSS